MGKVPGAAELCTYIMSCSIPIATRKEVLKEIDPAVSSKDPQSANLLRVFYVIRAADTFICALITQCDPSQQPKRFRDALNYLRPRAPRIYSAQPIGHLSPEQYVKFVNLSFIRNDYMHVAGKAPANEAEADALISRFYDLVRSVLKLAGKC